MATSNSPTLGEGVDPDRRFAPLDTLSFPEEDADSRRQHNYLPGGKDEQRQPTIEHGSQCQARDDPMQHSEEGIGQKAVGNGVRMHHPPASWREDFETIQRVVLDELKCHQKAAGHRNEHVRQRRQKVPADQTLIDQLNVLRSVDPRGIARRAFDCLFACGIRHMEKGVGSCFGSRQPPWADEGGVISWYGVNCPHGCRIAMTQPKIRWVPAATQGGRMDASVIQLPPNNAGCSQDRTP